MCTGQFRSDMENETMGVKVNRTDLATVLKISLPTVDEWRKIGKLPQPRKFGDHQQSPVEFDMDEVFASLADWYRAEGEHKASGYEETAKLFASDPDPLTLLKSFKHRPFPLPTDKKDVK
jgi:hypothetical protein